MCFVIKTNSYHRNNVTKIIIIEKSSKVLELKFWKLNSNSFRAHGNNFLSFLVTKHNLIYLL